MTHNVPNPTPDPTIRRVDGDLCPRCGFIRIDSRFDTTWMTTDRRVIEGQDVPGVFCEPCGRLEVRQDILDKVIGDTGADDLRPLAVLESDRAWRVRVGLLPVSAMDDSPVIPDFRVRNVDWSVDDRDGGHSDK